MKLLETLVDKLIDFDISNNSETKIRKKKDKRERFVISFKILVMVYLIEVYVSLALFTEVGSMLACHA